jgi:hypothetical protein
VVLPRIVGQVQGQCVKTGCLSKNSIHQALRKERTATLSSVPLSEGWWEIVPDCRAAVALCVLRSAYAPQRGPELSPLGIRWSLFSSRPLTHCRIIMLTILVDSGLLTAHPFPCFIEFSF